MKHKIYIIFTAIALVVSMVPGGACTGLSANQGKTPCENKQGPQKAYTTPAPGDCHMTSCPAQDERLFLVPESTCRRLPDKNRPFLLLPAIAASPQMISAPGLFQSGRFIFKQPLSFHPPPLFCLYCVYIC